MKGILRLGEQEISAANDDVIDTESALVTACQSGDRAAFRELYTLHINRVFALCLRLSGDQDEAADIAQEVFIQVWDNIANFKGNSAFKTWLHRVATNVAISHIRKRKHWWQRIINKQESVVEEPSVPLEINESGLESAIAQLPEQARLVFVLFAVEGYRHEEISQILGIAVGSSKSQFFRAKKLLKEHLSNE